MKKRLLSLLLSLVMLLTMAPITALADGSSGNVSMVVTPSAGTMDTLRIGDTVQIVVSNSAMTVSTFTFNVKFDKEKFECTSIVGADSEYPDDIGLEKESGKTTWVSAHTKSTLSEANNTATVGFGWAATDDTKYKAATIVTITFKAKATGSADFVLNENSGGTDGYKNTVSTTSATILKAPITTVTASVDDPVKVQPLDTTVDIGTATGYTGAVEWYEGTGVTGSAVTGNAKPNQVYTAKITLTAKPGESFADSVTIPTGYTKDSSSTSSKLVLTKAFPATGSVKVTSVEIGGPNPSLNVPEALGIDQPNTVKVTNTYSVTVHTDDGTPLTNPSGVEWSISDLDGVTVDPATGDMTISSNCPGGEIKLTATYGGVSVLKPATLPVWRATSAAKWLKIVDKKTGGAPQTTIIRPVGTESTDTVKVEYEAKVYDQFSKPVTIERAYWTLDPMPQKIGAPVTVNAPIQELLVTHNTEAISFDLTAAFKTGSTIKDTVTIKVEDKPLKPLTVTQADTTYGTPLAAPVFTVPEGTTKTLVHYSTPTSSGYSSDTPPTNAGAYVVNVVCETDTHIYTGHADFKIKPKSISNMLQPITGTYEYDGTPQKPTAVVMDGTKPLVEGTDYTVSYGTNVHVYQAATVYVEGKGNYTGTFSRNFKIQPKPIDITSVSTTDRDYVEGKLDVDCTVTLPVASAVKQGTHYHVYATMDDDTAGTNKTVNVLVKMEKGGLGENYKLNKDTTTATVNINQINPTDPTGLKGVKGNALSTVELPAGWNWDAPSTVMDTAGTKTFKAHYAGDANHIAVTGQDITVHVLDKTDVSSFITFPNGEKEYTGSWMEYKEASISGTNLGTGAKWNYVYTAGTGTLMTAGFPEGIGTYTVTATYEDSINFGIATATLTIVPKKVAIPAADTTVFTYDGTAKTYGISDTADYTVTGNSQTNAGDHTVTVALRDKATTAWADGTNTDKTYTFTIKQATPTGEPAYTKITTSGKTLADAGLTVTGSTLKPDAGKLEWVDDAGNALPDTTTVAANTTYKWRFTPTNTNYTTLTGSIKLYHKSSSSGGSSHSSRYTITVDSVKHGTITVSPKSAYKGDTVTITVKPDKGYELDTLKVLDQDGDKVKITEKKGKYTFTMPASKVTIKGKFVEEAPEQIFADVPVDAYCYEAVKWAASEGITGGIGNNLFAPGLPCTRGQIVTFLWRAAGSPAPKSMSSFADVAEDAYYAKAVAWAVENGITGGTGDGKFSPDATCTRAQAVTFLYRASGSPAVSGSAAFSDVATDAYYASAVKWAEKNGITGGIGNGLFGSGNNCTRGQIVTFLYRAMK